MTAEPTLERVREVVSRVAGPDRIPPGAGLDTPLGDGGFWLDSVGVLEAVLACEAEFDVIFDAETDLTAAALGTIGTLRALIRAKRAR